MNKWRKCKKTGYMYRINYRRLFEKMFYVWIGIIIALISVSLMFRFIAAGNQKDIDRLVGLGYTRQQAIEAVICE